VLGPFRLDSEAEILFKGTEPVGLGRRAVALLRVLVERPGAPVSKHALMESAWGGLVVEEANLTVQVAALRRVLSEESAMAISTAINPKFRAPTLFREWEATRPSAPSRAR
jgi:DNA-binding winged helix-turn-helix (wHTH) protein